jgi:hypothetical protein
MVTMDMAIVRGKGKDSYFSGANPYFDETKKSFWKRIWRK